MLYTGVHAAIVAITRILAAARPGGVVCAGRNPTTCPEMFFTSRISSVILLFAVHFQFFTREKLHITHPFHRENNTGWVRRPSCAHCTLVTVDYRRVDYRDLIIVIIVFDYRAFPPQ